MSGVSIPLWRVAQMTNDTGDGMTLGLDLYPIFDEAERVPLNKKILAHYWMRDIGVETVALFVHYTRAKMNEIMPMYNKLYLSERIQFDPLATYNLETIRSGTASENGSRGSNSTNSTDSGSKSRSVNGVTPQVQLAGQGDYASSVADANATSTASGTTTSSDTRTDTSSTSDTSRTQGYQGAASDLLTRYRSTILNLDMNVIDDIRELFALVFNDHNTGPYFEHGALTWI